MDIFDFDSDLADSGDALTQAQFDQDLPSLIGDNNSPPLQSDTSTQRTPSLLDLLGSIGTTARDVGTAVGTAQRDIKNAGANYSAAKNAAAQGNSLQTWWMYASTTDKMMVGLGLAALAVAIYQVTK